MRTIVVARQTSHAGTGTTTLLTGGMKRLAKKASRDSKLKFKLGAVIKKGSRVLAYSENLGKTCPEFGSGPYKSLHAEAAVIKKCIRSGICIKGATIMVYRKNDRTSKPCECCQTLIEAVGIKKVIYYEDGVKKEMKL